MHALLALALGIDRDVGFWVLLLSDVLTFASVPSVLRRRRGRPVAALAWLLALVGLPFVGVAMWWLLARTRLEGPLRRRGVVALRVCQACPPLSRSPEGLPPGLRGVTPFALEGARLADGVFPPAAVDDAELLVDGAAFFSALERAISSARSEVRVQTYIWNDDATGRRLAELLATKAREGVRVRVLVDGVGASGFGLRLCMTRAGVRVATFLPLRFGLRPPPFNLRNHRKLFWIDGEIAFVGGMNVGVEYEERWHDLAVRLTGPIVVHVGEAFHEDWAFATGEELRPPDAVQGQATDQFSVLISGGPDRAHRRIEDALVLAASSARSRLWLITPYLVPTEALRSALRIAALRGVDVRVVAPGRSDVPLARLASRAFYRELLEDGVRIFELQNRVLHAKGVLVDDDVTLLGSVNLDERSLRLNFELLLCTASAKLADQLARALRADMAASREVELDELSAESRWSQLAESAANLLSPFL